MSHVDEGRLHAHLDGELEALDPAGAAELARHLEECAQCRRRLEEEARIRSRARAILADADPALPRIPPWEGVVARPEAGRVRRRWISPAAAGAWAASLLLALALGWYASARRPEGAPVATRVEEGRRGVFEAAPEAGEQVAVGAPERREEAVAGNTAAPPAARGASGRTPPEEPPPAIADVDPNQQAVSAEDFSGVGQAGGVARAVEGGTPQAAVEPIEVVEERAAAPAPPPAPPAPAAVAAPAADAAATGWRAVPLAEAQRILGGRVARVEGVPVLAYQVGEVDGRVAVRTVQRLEQGTLELVQRRPVSTARREAARGRTQAAPAAPAPPTAVTGVAVVAAPVTVVRSGWEITVRAPVPPDSLRALAERIRP